MTFRTFLKEHGIVLTLTMQSKKPKRKFYDGQKTIKDSTLKVHYVWQPKRKYFMISCITMTDKEQQSDWFDYFKKEANIIKDWLKKTVKDAKIDIHIFTKEESKIISEV